MCSVHPSLQGSEMTLEYPGWALGMIVMLILLASLPVPIGYIHSTWKSRQLRHAHSEEGAGPEVHRELYTKCDSTDQLDSSSHRRAPSEEDEARPRTIFHPIGSEHYRLLPQHQEEEEDEEQDTGVWAQLREESGLFVTDTHKQTLSERESLGCTLSSYSSKLCIADKPK